MSQVYHLNAKTNLHLREIKQKSVLTNIELAKRFAVNEHLRNSCLNALSGRYQSCKSIFTKAGEKHFSSLPLCDYAIMPTKKDLPFGY